MKKWQLYEWSVIVFFLVFPVTAIIFEVFFFQTIGTYREVALKWFVFSGVGLRLGSAGIKQIVQPKFTAKEIFKLEDDAVYPLVRELGFTNICFAVIAIISLFVPSFRIPAAIAGGLYFGLAGLQHIRNRSAGNEEIFAMTSDFFIFIVLFSCIFMSLG